MKPGALYVFTSLVALFFTYSIFTSYTNREDDRIDGLEKKNSLPQVIQSIDLDQSFSFAGEALPMDNFDVRERLDRELMVNSYWHSSTIMNIKSAHRYFPEIEKILAEQGIPDDLKYLAVAESSLRNASSPAGAKGIWQFLGGTARDFGLEVGDEVDERYHLEKSTLAACRYLKKLRDRFGSWTMAAAAYNVGASKLAKHIEAQRADSYFDLNLNEETSRYVFRIVALKEILSRPKDFGFYLDPEDLYSPLDHYQTITIKGSVPNWGDFAKAHGTSYRLLKVYNPWLRASQLTNSKGREYEVRVPK